MPWRSDRTRTLDLRTDAGSEGPISAVRRRVYLVALAVAGLASVGVLILAVASGVSERELPFRIANLGGYWVLCDVRDPSLELRDHDLVTAVAGTVVPVSSAEPEAQRRLFDAVRESRSIRLRTVRSTSENTGACGTLLSVDTTGVAPRETVVSALRPRWYRALLDILGYGTFLLVATLGAITLRARRAHDSVGKFLTVCVVYSVGAVGLLLALWARWSNPIFFATPGSIEFGLAQIGLVPGTFAFVVIAYLLVLFAAFLDLLHVFPERDDELATRYPVPYGWLVLMLTGTLVLALGVVEPVASGGGGQPGLLSLTSSLVIAAFALLPMALLLILPTRIFRIARERVRSAQTPEARHQTRMALLGVQVGFLLVTLAFLLVIVRVALVSHPTSRAIAGGLSYAGFTAAPATIFIGFFLAILRRGLWDADLILRKATVYSVLAAAFFVAWPLLEVGLEMLLPSGLFGVAWLDTAGATLIAGAIVAASRSWVTRTLDRGVFREIMSLGDAIEMISGELDTSVARKEPAAHVARRLSELLRASPCGVASASGPGKWSVAWSVGDGDLLARVAEAVAASASGAGGCIVTTDVGPVLAQRVGRRPEGPMLLLGARGTGRFYNREERQLLGVLLNQASMILPPVDG